MKSILPVLITVVGIAWQFGMWFLGVFGRMLDAIDLGNFATNFQLWLVNNPNLGNEVGPWIFIGLGTLSLSITHVVLPLYQHWRLSDLEIVYDPTDEDGRFGGFGLWHVNKSRDPPIQSFILRVGVQNNTRKTINTVTGTVEGSLTEQPFPVALRFSRTLLFEENLDPGRMLLMDIFGMAHDPDDWPDGVHQIIIRINGRDTPESKRCFNIDMSRMPAMYAVDC